MKHETARALRQGEPAFANRRRICHDAILNHPALLMTNQLYYGDNLGVLREHIADASVDLVYLDPPFNSNATYNVLFKAPDGVQSQAQIEAFDDTWHWTEHGEPVHTDETEVAAVGKALSKYYLEQNIYRHLCLIEIFL
jgi:site-specific DNA-methyltransferase (adenine-specific)